MAVEKCDIVISAVSPEIAAVDESAVAPVRIFTVVGTVVETGILDDEIRAGGTDAADTDSAVVNDIARQHETGQQHGLVGTCPGRAGEIEILLLQRGAAAVVTHHR